MKRPRRSWRLPQSRFAPLRCLGGGFACGHGWPLVSHRPCREAAQLGGGLLDAVAGYLSHACSDNKGGVFCADSKSGGDAIISVDAIRWRTIGRRGCSRRFCILWSEFILPSSLHLVEFSGLTIGCIKMEPELMILQEQPLVMRHHSRILKLSLMERCSSSSF